MKARTMVILWALSVIVILAVGLTVNASEKSGEPSKAAPSASPSAQVSSSPAESIPVPVSGGATCSPSGTSLHLVAKGLAFDTSCLAAPASQAFSVAFSNQDPTVLHNFAIYDPSGKELFKGDLVTGPAQTTYHVAALPAGTYVFKCDVHTAMTGTFVAS
jgi:plastocyanin